ncbi:hypothetical protein HDV06_004333 [Boothiomyces sp. JEL0866]|nr:hypothetical protein HDV06_004333 [Boothiomyces sp. JEL0866]
MAQEWEGQLKQLAIMGFTDVELNKRALYKTGGQFQAAIEYITNPSLLDQAPEQPSAPIYQSNTQQSYRPNIPARPEVRADLPEYIFPKLDADKAEKVLAIASMGFDDEGKIRHALTLSNWDLENAVAKLMDENDSLSSMFSGQKTGNIQQITPKPIDLPAVNHRSNSFGAPQSWTNSFNQPNQAPNRNANPFTVQPTPAFNNSRTSVNNAQVQNKNQNPFSDQMAAKYGDIQEFDPFADTNRI